MQHAITIKNLTKYFGSQHKKKTLLADLTFQVPKGQIFGFIGPNGAGKSTTIKLLLNFIKPDKGELSILDLKVGKDEFRYKVGYLSEFPCFYNKLTAEESLFFAGKLSGLPHENLQQKINALLEQVNLSDAARKLVGEFSKGMKQRLGCAAALLHDPELFILDEPMSGLDPVGRQLIKQFIKNLHARGKTIFFSSHILSDVEDLCDQIAVLHKGNLLYQGGLKNFSTMGNLEESFIELIDKWEKENA